MTKAMQASKACSFSLTGAMVARVLFELKNKLVKLILVDDLAHISSLIIKI